MIKQDKTEYLKYLQTVKDRLSASNAKISKIKLSETKKQAISKQRALILATVDRVKINIEQTKGLITNLEWKSTQKEFDNLFTQLNEMANNVPVLRNKGLVR